MPGDTEVTVSESTAPSGGTTPYVRNLYRSTSSGSKGSSIASAVTLPYTDTGRTNGTPYYYTLEVVDNVAATADTAQVSATPSASGATTLFYDDFASGDKSHTQNGISWGSDFYTYVTTLHPEGANVYSLEFRQGESINIAEQRWQGMADLTEVYLEWSLYMPDGSETPSLGPACEVQGPGANDKFLRVWSDPEDTSRIGASTFGSGGVGSLGLEYRYNDGSELWAMGQGPAPYPTTPLITPALLGQWVRIRIHFKTATAANNDGVAQFWINDSLVLDVPDLANYPYPSGAGNTYTDGYLLGAANSGFQAGQKMFIGYFRVSTGGFI